MIRSALMQGRALLGLGDLAGADERLHHALTRARAVNLVEYELPTLIALARLALARAGRTRRGRISTMSGTPPSSGRTRRSRPTPLTCWRGSSGMRAIATPPSRQRQEHTGHAWCDGPPYAYHWGLEAAKAHLAALGAPEPELPPFDEWKFDPLPEVEIVPPDEASA